MIFWSENLSGNSKFSLFRFAGSPDKVKFLKGTMNVIDCLAIAPYFLTLFFMPPTELGSLGDDSAVEPSPLAASDEPPLDVLEEDAGIGEVGRIMQVFRIARIMRIFKLARRSVGLQSIAYTVRTSWKGRGKLNSTVSGLVLRIRTIFLSGSDFSIYTICILSCINFVPRHFFSKIAYETSL
jgi:hypothetical protein